MDVVGRYHYVGLRQLHRHCVQQIAVLAARQQVPLVLARVRRQLLGAVALAEVQTELPHRLINFEVIGLGVAGFREYAPIKIVALR